MGVITKTSWRPDDEETSHKETRVQNLANRVNHSSKCRCCLWVVALWCASTVVFMLAGYDLVVQKVAVGEMILREGTQKYEAWRETPVPVYYKVFVFNLTNPRQFMAGDNPVMRECGPYVYLMKEVKENVKFYKNGTVSYRTRPFYYFQEHLSSGSPDDHIVTVNIPFVNAADAVKDQGIARTVIQIAKKIHGFKTLRTLSVNELLWGHRSRVMDWARTLQELPWPHQLFGLLVGFNDTIQEPYTMHTGKGEPNLMNQILAWNGKDELDFWGKNGDCNKIHGTDASGFAPGVTKEDTLHIFNGQLCRSIPLTYKETIKSSGIKAYRFVPPANTFAYGPRNPQNQCFCSVGGCPPRGILDMKPCYWGASVGFSFPHFYQADPKLLHVVKGLRPNESIHRTEFDIYPDLGVPLRVKLRMQMNVILNRDAALERARHYEIVFPIFWFEVGIDALPGEVVGLLKLAQNLPPVVKTTSVTLCTTLALIFLLLLLAQSVMSWCGWGSEAKNKRPATPDHLANNHHARPTLDYTPIKSRPYKGNDSARNSSSESSYKDSVSSTPLPPPGMEAPFIDDHTLLPPYRRRDTAYPDLPDSATMLGASAPIDGDSMEQHPPPYSPEKTRTPSTVSVEIHTTASDDELPDLPLDPHNEDLHSSDEHDEPVRVTPRTPPPAPGETVVAPLALPEKTNGSLERSLNGKQEHPQPPPYSPHPQQTSVPLATSSPQGSAGNPQENGSCDPHRNLPAPLESDL
ncbi:unnamed protein product [Meganyctiphanes norvegica]|uniref:Scavenger receptor class B member 1 n=1 Tax=Meganyctiphanes norvegica TaxID=48144 RepID=A0AAV2RJ22_MEGNR